MSISLLNTLIIYFNRQESNNYDYKVVINVKHIYSTISLME